MKNFPLRFLLLICALLLLLCTVACSDVQKHGSWNKIDLANEGLQAEYSRNFVDWTAVSENTDLFTTDIFSAGMHETVYLRLTNTCDTPIRFDLGIFSAYGISVPEALRFFTSLYVQEPISIPDFSASVAIGEGVSEARVLYPDESITASLTLFCDSEFFSAVSPLLALSVRASHMNYTFDPSSPDSYVMKAGEEIQKIIPRDIVSVRTLDLAEPLGTAVDDLSLGENGAVIGWREGDTYIISTRKTGQKAILNEFSPGFFAGCTNLTTVDLSLLDTSRTKDFMRFFSSCKSLTVLDLSNFDTANAVRMRSMFNGCSSLSTLILENWDVSSLKDASYMFASAAKLKTVDLSAWNLSSILYNTAMFQNCGVEDLRLPESLTVMDNLFLNHAKYVKTEVFHLPNGLVRAGLAHFLYNFGTSALVAYQADESNAAVKTVDGILYSKDGTKLLAIPKGKTFENGIYAIPEGVTLLGELSFSRNANVKTVLLPNSYRLTVYKETDHPDFADASGSGNLNVGNSLNLATYVYSGVCAYAVRDDNPVYYAENGVLYTKEAGKAASLIAVPVGFSGEMAVAEGVTSWAADALWEDAGVTYDAWTSLSIPASLTDIAITQIEKINSIPHLSVTVAQDNPIYTTDAEGNLCLK